jgi:anti-anti-sigma factor
MVRAETSSPISLLAGPSGSRPSDGSVDASQIANRLEDWIVSTIADPSEANEWEKLLGRIAPSRRTSKKSGKQTAPGGWSRFRLARLRGITIVVMTDESLIRDRELSELAGDLQALVEAGHHRLVLDFSGVERLSSWAVGAVVDALDSCTSQRGGALRVCGLGPQIDAIFSVAGVKVDVPIYPKAPAAIEKPWPETSDLGALPVAILAALRDETSTPHPQPAGLSSLRPGRLTVEDFPAMSGVRLIVEVGPSKGKGIEVAAARYLIGRDRTCHLRPSAAAVSRFHATIERRKGRLFLRDLGSTNGTAHNGQTLQNAETEIRDGDRLGFGPLSFTLAIDAVHKPEPGLDDIVLGWVGDRGPNGLPAGDDPTATLDDAPAFGDEDRPPLKHEVIENVVIVTPLVSELDDEPAIGPLRAELLAIFERPLPRRVVIDLSQVGHLSGRAIGVLVAHHLKLDQAGGALRICHAHPRVAAVLDQVKLAMLIECLPTIDDAVLSAWGRAAD